MRKSSTYQNGGAVRVGCSAELDGGQWLAADHHLKRPRSRAAWRSSSRPSLAGNDGTQNRCSATLRECAIHERLANQLRYKTQLRVAEDSPCFRQDPNGVLTAATTSTIAPARAHSRSGAAIRAAPEFEHCANELRDVDRLSQVLVVSRDDEPLPVVGASESGQCNRRNLAVFCADAEARY